jgi:hypothetical protein
MKANFVVGVAGVVVLCASLAALGGDEPPAKTGLGNILNELATPPLAAELPVRVVDSDGKPIAGARVTPWALRSSQGHGWWRKADRWAGMDPEDAQTDASGLAKVRYPYYRERNEQIRTTGVSLQIDHPEFAYTSDMHIDVPLESDGPYQIKLKRGVPVEVRPTMGGEPFPVENLFALWSDGRSWLPGASAEKIGDHALRIPAMPPGENSVFLVKLDGERATHFSKIVDFQLTEGEPKTLGVAMKPALRIDGVLGENVPRPVKDGRVKAWSLTPSVNHARVSWWTWAPVQADGTFALDWPEGEPVQLIALCKGFRASNGATPAGVGNPYKDKTDPFGRPQVFLPSSGEKIELAMTALTQCKVSAIDEDEKPVAGSNVLSYPNVCWWNGGSQIYCHPLLRGERLVRTRDYFTTIDPDFGNPFEATTDARGQALLELPSGREHVVLDSEIYELPIILGSRDVRVELSPDKTTEVVLHIQPRGTEKLGEWDKLAGVVFGCSTREGRRICALPEVRAKMDKFETLFQIAKNRRDPKLLSEAYLVVADAFANVGDAQESANWRKKAEEQAEKARGASEKAGDKGTAE